MKSLEKWCKDYVHRWLHVEVAPREGWINYCMYKLYFRWRNPIVGFRGLLKGPTRRFKVVGKTTILPHMLEFTHPVTNDLTDRKLKQRIETLKKLPKRAHFSQADLQELMPSINNIRVLLHNGKYKLCDGHGRVYALLQTHFHASIEVDIIEPEGNMQYKTASLGDLRIKRKFATIPVEFKPDHKLWLETYFSLEHYVEDYSNYDTVKKWKVFARVPEKNLSLPSLLVDPDPVMRSFAKLLYKIKQGDESLVAPEEVTEGV